MAELRLAASAAFRGQLRGHSNCFLPEVQGANSGIDSSLAFPAGGELSLDRRAPTAIRRRRRSFCGQVGDPPNHGTAPRARP